MKVTSLIKKHLVELVTGNMTESLIDLDAEELRIYVCDLETGVTKPICTWTRQELIDDLLSDQECSKCGASFFTGHAHVHFDDPMIRTYNTSSLYCAACCPCSK